MSRTDFRRVAIKLDLQLFIHTPSFSIRQQLCWTEGDGAQGNAENPSRPICIFMCSGIFVINLKLIPCRSICICILCVCVFPFVINLKLMAPKGILRTPFPPSSTNAQLRLTWFQSNLQSDSPRVLTVLWKGGDHCNQMLTQYAPTLALALPYRGILGTSMARAGPHSVLQMVTAGHTSLISLCTLVFHILYFVFHFLYFVFHVLYFVFHILYFVFRVLYFHSVLQVVTVGHTMCRTSIISTLYFVFATGFNYQLCTADLCTHTQA